MLAFRHVRHRYGQEVVLDVPRFDAAAGTHGLVVGLSGSGKSTFLHLAAGLLQPTEGTVVVAGQELSGLSGPALDRFRGRHIGIVFQQLHLLSSLTVEDNVLLAPYLAGLPLDRARARSVLANLDLGDQRAKYPAQLSTGQRQRVALARAVMNRPRLLLADEPTASLDDVRSARVLDLLAQQAEATGATLLIATHDHRVKARFPLRLELALPPTASAPH
jgi:putative ABC transport system ATP-binding protein